MSWPKRVVQLPGLGSWQTYEEFAGIYQCICSHACDACVIRFMHVSSDVSRFNPPQKEAPSESCRLSYPSPTRSPRVDELTTATRVASVSTFEGFRRWTRPWHLHFYVSNSITFLEGGCGPIRIPLSFYSTSVPSMAMRFLLSR